jgi:hypothetical protein
MVMLSVAHGIILANLATVDLRTHSAFSVAAGATNCCSKRFAIVAAAATVVNSDALWLANRVTYA